MELGKKRLDAHLFLTTLGRKMPRKRKITPKVQKQTESLKAKRVKKCKPASIVVCDLLILSLACNSPIVVIKSI